LRARMFKVAFGDPSTMIEEVFGAADNKTIQIELERPITRRIRVRYATEGSIVFKTSCDMSLLPADHSTLQPPDLATGMRLDSGNEVEWDSSSSTHASQFDFSLIPRQDCSGETPVLSMTWRARPKLLVPDANGVIVLKTPGRYRLNPPSDNLTELLSLRMVGNLAEIKSLDAAGLGAIVVSGQADRGHDADHVPKSRRLGGTFSNGADIVLDWSERPSPVNFEVSSERVPQLNIGGAQTIKIEAGKSMRRVFTAPANDRYVFETMNLAENTDTILKIYDLQSMTLLDSNDDFDSSLRSVIILEMKQGEQIMLIASNVHEGAVRADLKASRYTGQYDESDEDVGEEDED